MIRMRWLVLLACVCALVAAPKRYKPGFNLFSVEQDVQLGKEAAQEIEKEYEVVNDPRIRQYVDSLGGRLASRPEAGKFPYTFKVVSDPAINAFALPGGPTYLNTGLILAADSEGQLVGVMAHEISHVALRHGTNQVSKAQAVRIPALLAGAVAGNGMLGQLSQLGIGIGANSLLLSFSRGAETQADLNGAQIMAGAGYNPIEMARFFEKLEDEGGSRGPQFLSSHPNPGNRRRAIENQQREMPRTDYRASTGQFQSIQELVARLPAPKRLPKR